MSEHTTTTPEEAFDAEPDTKEEMAEANACFDDARSVSMMNEYREEIRNAGGHTIDVCHGAGYCHYSPDDRDGIDACVWCEKIDVHKSGAMKVILNDMVRKRTTGRH